MGKASMTDAEPPENNSILTAETTQITVAEERFNLFETHLSQSHFGATSEYRSVAGHFTADILRLRADLAASSPSSLPLIPVWLGIHIRIMIFPEFDNWL